MFLLKLLKLLLGLESTANQFGNELSGLSMSKLSLSYSCCAVDVAVSVRAARLGSIVGSCTANSGSAGDVCEVLEWSCGWCDRLYVTSFTYGFNTSLFSFISSGNHDIQLCQTSHPAFFSRPL